MEDFAKLYRADDLGQVLVIKRSYIVTVRFAHPDGKQMCMLRSEMPDNEIGWEKADGLFSMMDEAFTLRMVRDLLQDKDFDRFTTTGKGSMDA